MQLGDVKRDAFMARITGERGIFFRINMLSFEAFWGRDEGRAGVWVA